MPDEYDDSYGQFARNLADALMRYARDRRAEDKKAIAELHGELCKIRRAELKEYSLSEG